MAPAPAAVIVAAGRGTRAGRDLPKQWCDLAGRPVLAHTLAAFRCAGISRILLVLHPDDIARARPLLGDGVQWVAGGAQRAASVRNALESLAANAPPEQVLIHDGARPLLPGAVIARVRAALDRGARAAAPALPVTDALWRGGTDGRVTGTQDRTALWRAQTPQGFGFETILRAHRTFGGNAAADDVEIARAAGVDVEIVAGDEDNLKLTWPDDFARAEAILRTRQQSDGPEHSMDIRTGNGFDVHRFGPLTEGARGCWLCGVEVPHARGLQGHSDADVGMHALTDAIYGALAEGDIGQHFPPSDPQWKGAESRVFLRHAVELAQARGFRISHVDVTLICEQPKIGPHAGAMRSALATIMGLDVGRISVKATTTEQLGFAGRGEGIAALATATLVAP